jgi:DnaJ-class molecular chaperone
MYKRFDTGDPDEYVAVCPDCDGEGSRDVVFVHSETPEWVKCPDCDGKGNISADADDFE